MDGIRWISMTMSERILIMVKNKVVLKERDAWSDLANFIKRRILKNSEMQNSLLKEKLSHDIITVKTDI